MGGGYIGQGILTLRQGDHLIHQIVQIRKQRIALLDILKRRFLKMRAAALVIPDERVVRRLIGCLCLYRDFHRRQQRFLPGGAVGPLRGIDAQRDAELRGHDARIVLGL